MALLPFLFILGITACGSDNQSNADDKGSNGGETEVGPTKTVNYIQRMNCSLTLNVVSTNIQTARVHLHFRNKHCVVTDKNRFPLSIVFII